MFGVLKSDSSLEQYHMTYDGSMCFPCAGGQRFLKFVQLHLLLRTSCARLLLQCPGDM